MIITKTIRRRDDLYISASAPVLVRVLQCDAVVVEALIDGPDDMRVEVREAQQVDGEES